ncbi:hypothetical protein BJX62DRAFT_193055 [Aspergillus germanicus]
MCEAPNGFTVTVFSRQLLFCPIAESVLHCCFESMGEDYLVDWKIPYTPPDTPFAVQRGVGYSHLWYILSPKSSTSIDQIWSPPFVYNQPLRPHLTQKAWHYHTPKTTDFLSYPTPQVPNPDARSCLELVRPPDVPVDPDLQIEDQHPQTQESGSHRACGVVEEFH